MARVTVQWRESRTMQATIDVDMEWPEFRANFEMGYDSAVWDWLEESGVEIDGGIVWGEEEVIAWVAQP